MTTHIYKQGKGEWERKVNTLCCRASLKYGGRQCVRRVAVERKFGEQMYGFCRQHDPQTVEACEEKREEACRKHLARIKQNGDRIALQRKIADAMLNYAEEYQMPRNLQRLVSRYRKLRET